MGAGASILQGGKNNIEQNGGAFGYTVDFVAGHFDTSDSDSCLSDESITMADAFDDLY